MTRSLDGDVSVLIEHLNISSGGSVGKPRLPRSVINRGSHDLSQADLSFSRRTGGNIHISAVDQDVDIRSVFDGVLVVRDHRLSTGSVLPVGGEVAEGPLTSRGRVSVDGGLDVLSVQVVSSDIDNSGFGVLQQGELPLESGVSGDEVLPQVVGVKRRLSSVEGENTELLVDLTHAPVSSLEDVEALDALAVLGAIVVDPLAVGDVRDQLVLVEDSHLSVEGVQRITGEHGVSGHLSSELLVDSGAGARGNQSSESGNVDTTIRLTGDPGRATNVFGVGIKKSLNEVEVFLSSLLVVAGVGVAWLVLARVRETNTGGLL